MLLVISCAGACSGPQTSEPPRTAAPMASTPPPPLPLCTALKPQFDRITQEFNLGGALRCEDVPGVVTLGQFGVGDKLDRSLLGCVDDNARFASATSSEPAAVSGVEYTTETTTDANGSLGLGRIAPWLPDVKAARGAGERLHVRLSVAEATWDSLPAIGRIFEGQNHAFDCLPALCHDDAQLVYKTLRGRVEVEVRTDNASGFSTGVTLLGGSTNFSLEEQTKSSSNATLRSNEKLVLAIVAKGTKPELTDDGHCDGCGARGQPCCEVASTCDDALACVDGICRPRGYPNAPCDEGRCSNSATCVRGICRAGCGAEGLACCDKGGCGEGCRCQAGQPARREIPVVDESVERKGGFFGTDAALELGSATCGDGRLRSRFATLKVEGDSAHCDHAAWMADNDSNDCRIKVHLHVSPFGAIRCRIQVFATELDPRVPAPQSLCK